MWTSSYTWDPHKPMIKHHYSSEDHIGAGTLSRDGTSSTMEKQSHQFSYKDKTLQVTCPCQYCSTNVRAGRWQQIWQDESKSLKTNAAGGCLVYHTESIKPTDTHVNRPISSPDIRNFYYQLSSVASYHGSAMSAVMIRCLNHTTGNSRW